MKLKGDKSSSETTSEQPWRLTEEQKARKETTGLKQTNKLVGCYKIVSAESKVSECPPRISKLFGRGSRLSRRDSRVFGRGSGISCRYGGSLLSKAYFLCWMGLFEVQSHFSGGKSCCSDGFDMGERRAVREVKLKTKENDCDWFVSPKHISSVLQSYSTLKIASQLHFRFHISDSSTFV